MENINNLPIYENTMELIPELLDDGVDLKRYKRIPLADLAALGVGFNSISTAIWNMGPAGGSGIYRVTVPNGGTMMKFTDKSAYLGSVAKKGGGVGGGQARLNPVAFDPTMVFMAVALMNIEHKLNVIQETQEEILQFLEQKEKTNLKGNIVFMSDIMNNYKFNWNNEDFLDSRRNAVVQIQKEAEQSLLFAQSRIKSLAAKKKLIKFSPDVKTRIKKLKGLFEDYQLSVYMYAMASYVEAMLTKNFNKGYMYSIADKIENYSIDYRDLYTDCYDLLSEYYDTAIDTMVISGVAKATKSAGEVLSKVPIIGAKTSIDDNLVAIGEIMEDPDGTIKLNKLSDIVSKQSSSVQPFVESVRGIGELYDRPLTVAFDNENIYLETDLA